ncbi:hypothetical protein [Thalassobacillus sp. CUG 92003]|uniref:hypothetical protein n=1 Tax=Thalassobacillus sp. CUG 92003 TaxID=2736641 RepID=UPI002106168B|nr:hypothetical protein [Thalassobacillus sp. CUG 92003]
MSDTEWDIQEGKHLKKKRLVHYNLVMLLLAGLLPYYFKIVGSGYVLFVLCCVFMWAITMSMLYTLKTGKTIGTKTSRLVEDFDKSHKGEERWKRSKITEFALVSIMSVVLTTLLFVIEFDSGSFNFPISYFPFIGGWVGLALI